MIVALTRDGQFKVESITDEFVTLDTNTRLDVMAKLNAVVEGNMDEGYNFREENVNDSERRGGSNKNAGNAGGSGDAGGEDEKKGKKRVTTPKSGGRSSLGGVGGGAAKKRKISVSAKK